MCACVATVSFASSTEEAGVVERLGETVPGDVHFVDSTGDTLLLADLVDRPTILALVYYSCPSVCRPLLEEVGDMQAKLEKLDLTPGDDYRILTVSFDFTDRPEDSERMKAETYASLPEGYPDSAWLFLTGDEAAIDAITSAVGFRYRRSGDDFAHATTLVVLSPQRKITRYLTGAEYLPVDIKLALIEASEGRVGTTIVKFVRFCFSYDPEGRKYVLNTTRVVGASTLIGLAGFVVFLTAAGRRRGRTAGTKVG